VSDMYEFIILRQKDAVSNIRPQIGAYIEAARSMAGSIAAKHFQSFHALPQPDVLPVFILVFQWARHNATDGSLNQLQASSAFTSLIDVADIERHTMAEQVDGNLIDVATLASGDGQILEFVVRRIKEGQEEAYTPARKVIFSAMATNEAVINGYELRPVIGEDTERLTIGMVVYKDQASLQQIDFMGNPAVLTFFSTFDIEMLKFASPL
jgi:hypothetical protein